MKRLILFLFLISFYSLKSQNFDSLLIVSVKLPHDTERVNLLYREGFEKRLSWPQYSYDCAKQAEHIGMRCNSPRHLAKAYNLFGVLFYRKGELKKALDYHIKALDLRQSINDEAGIALSETNLGNIYTDLRKYDLAEKSYMNALQLNNKLGNEKQTGNCYLNLGVLFMNLNKMEEAEKYFLNAYKIAKTIMDYELEAMCLNNLAVINIENQEYESAISNCMDALKAKEIMGNEIEKTDSYINLAKAYYKINDEKNGEYYLRKADSLCKAYDYLEAKCTMLQLRAQIYETTHKFDLALIAYKEYNLIKDSINAQNEALRQEYYFNEKLPELKKRIEPFHISYLMIFTLSLLTILITYIVFNNKR
jgi:tetratricopeptide (TPR) repeat protein